MLVPGLEERLSSLRAQPFRALVPFRRKAERRLLQIMVRAAAVVSLFLG